MNKSGSAFVFVLVIMSGLLLYSATVWRTTSYVVDIALQREQYEHHYWAACSLMQWSLALAKKNFSIVYHKAATGPLRIPLASWPPQSSSTYSATIAYTIQSEHALAIQINLFEQHRSDPVCSLSCCLEQHDDVYKIFDWKTK